MKQQRSNTTRAALMDSARKLFSEKGFDGTSVREIAAAAGANLAAVTYHFGAKESLYAAVVESALAPLAELLVATARETGSPLDRVESFVRTHFAYLCDHPELPRLMLRSLLDTGLPPAAANDHLTRVISSLVGLISEGQRDGSIRDGIPTVMAIGALSQSMHISLMRGALVPLAKLDAAAVRDPHALPDDIARSVRGGLVRPTGAAS